MTEPEMDRGSTEPEEGNKDRYRAGIPIVINT